MTSRDELDIRKSLDPSPDQNIDMKNSDDDKDKVLVFNTSRNELANFGITTSLTMVPGNAEPTMQPAYDSYL